MAQYLTRPYHHFLLAIIFFFGIFLELSSQSCWLHSSHLECPFWKSMFLCLFLKSFDGLSLYLARDPTRTKIFFPVSIILFQTTCALTGLAPSTPSFSQLQISLTQDFAGSSLTSTPSLDGFVLAFKSQISYQVWFFSTISKHLFIFDKPLEYFLCILSIMFSK